MSFLSCVTQQKKIPKEKEITLPKKTLKFNKEKYLWIVRTHLKTKTSIDAILKSADENNIEDLIVQVRGLGDAYYRSSIVPLADGLKALDFIPLDYLLKEALKKNLKVHAWVNVFLGAKEKTFHSKNYSQHILNKKSQWFLKNCQGKAILNYAQKSLEQQSIDGYYLDPSKKELRRYLLSVFEELLLGYPQLAGLHLDFVRYPYSKKDSEFNFACGEDPSKHVSSFVKELRTLQRTSFPKIQLSAAVWAHARKARENVYQDWRSWLADGDLDFVMPMFYVIDKSVYEKRLQEFAFLPEEMKKIIVGVGLYRKPPWRVLSAQLNSVQKDFKGVAFFSSSFFTDEKQSELEAQLGAHLKALN